MKVLVGIPCLMTGGTEIQTLNLVKALVAAEHEVTTVCYFEFTRNIVGLYERAGSKVILLSDGSGRPEGVLATVRFLYKRLKHAIKKIRPDIAHVQYMAPGAIPIILIRLLGVKRIIATAHTHADIYSSLLLLRLLTNHFLRAFQCITERAEQSFFGTSQLYGPQLKLRRFGNHFTIYNNLPSYISIAQTSRQFIEPITIGVVSRLERIKGMDLIIPAYAQVLAKHVNVGLLVVGDGTLRKVMEKQAEKHGIRDNVEFAGRQPQEDLERYYDRIDILLMPSRSEGFGLTAIEGMARGSVVIAANTGGLPEVVIDGVVGLLHIPESVTDIVAKIDQILSQPEKLRQMSMNAITHVSRFSSDSYNRLIEDLYQKIY